MMTVEHHAEFVDLGKYGSIEVTRDDTDELQDYHLIAWKNGRKTHEIRSIYNIQYDYYRHQEWWKGQLIEDLLFSGNSYGHLLFEYSLQPPPGWKRPEVMWEPVTPIGTEMFRLEGLKRSMTLVENLVFVDICFYNLKYYEEWRLPAKLLDTVRIIDKPYQRCFIDEERQEKRKHVLYRHGRLSPLWLKTGKVRHRRSFASRIRRFHFFKEHSEEIKVEVPFDPRMVY